MIVGRDAYLRELTAAAQSAGNGRGGLSLLAGEAGVGKSRLAAELFERVRSEGFVTAWTSGQKDATGSPYWPWSRLLEQLGDAKSLSVERTESDPTLARLVLAQAVANVVLAAATSRPVLLVFDDLHWMDEGSLWLLAAVRSETARAPVMLLGTYRDTEPGGERLIDRLAPDRNLVLVGLSPHALGQAVLELTGERLSPGLVTDLCRRTGGNPYFTAEIVRLLRAEGRLDSECLGAELPLPPTVRSVLQRRIARLGIAARPLLEVAALTDEPVDTRLVAEVLDQPVEATTAQLQGASEARLLTRTGHGYRFAHPLVREALAAGCLPINGCAGINVWDRHWRSASRPALPTPRRRLGT